MTSQIFALRSVEMRNTLRFLNLGRADQDRFRSMALEAPRNHRAAVYGGASGVACPSAGHRQLVDTNGTSGLTFNDDRGPIRFGIMCRGRRLAAWQAETIRRLLAIEGVSLSLLITDPRPSPGGGKVKTRMGAAHCAAPTQI